MHPYLQIEATARRLSEADDGKSSQRRGDRRSTNAATVGATEPAAIPHCSEGDLLPIGYRYSQRVRTATTEQRVAGIDSELLANRVVAYLATDNWNVRDAILPDVSAIESVTL